MRVKPAALREIRGGHPWVFDGSIVSIGEGGRAGDLAVIFDDKRRFAAIGLYDPDSPIRVRILHRGDSLAIDDEWLQATIRSAINRRQPLRDRPDTTAYRIIHGENDDLGGLVADLYGAHVVLKMYSTAWEPWLLAIADALQAALGDDLKSITVRTGRKVGSPGAEPAVLLGTPPADQLVILENGIKVEVDLRFGHKTGYFLDQRHNRSLIRDNSSGRDVLDVFSSTGGFSVHAASGGATSVTAIDVAKPALEQAARTFALNGFSANAPFFVARHGDAFELLTEMVDAQHHFDLVIVDPPSMASRQDQVGRALDAYQRLASLAGRLVSSGGLLYLASCTARVTPDEFRQASFDALRRVGVKTTLVEETGHDIDHPVSFAEGRYLKGLLLAVS